MLDPITDDTFQDFSYGREHTNRMIFTWLRKVTMNGNDNSMFNDVAEVILEEKTVFLRWGKKVDSFLPYIRDCKLEIFGGGGEGLDNKQLIFCVVVKILRYGTTKYIVILFRWICG